MGNRNEKSTIKELFYLILGTLLISLSIYLISFTTGDSDKPSPAFVSKEHQESSKLVDRQIYAEWDKEVLEAPKVDLVQLNKVEKKEEEISQQEEKWMNFISTAYVSDCPGCTGFTYWKEWDVRNTIYSPQGYRVIASDPNVLPMGTLVRVRYGDTEFTARVMDIGGKIKSRKIDLLVSTEKKAYQWGVKNVEIKVIEWGG